LAQLIRPSTVKVLSQDGEVKVTIALELTINLNSDGLQVSAAAREDGVSETVEKKKLKQKEETAMWEIPDFGPVPKVDFGKKN